MWSAQHYLELLLITVKLEPNQAFRSNVLLIEWLENKLNGTYKETVKQIQSGSFYDVVSALHKLITN